MPILPVLTLTFFYTYYLCLIIQTALLCSTLLFPIILLHPIILLSLFSYSSSYEDAILDTVEWREQFGIHSIYTSQFSHLVKNGLGKSCTSDIILAVFLSFDFLSYLSQISTYKNIIIWRFKHHWYFYSMHLYHPFFFKPQFEIMNLIPYQFVS